MRLAVACLTLVAFVAWADAPPDAGAEQATFDRLRELAAQYGCPDAGPPALLDGGAELLSSDRVERNACIETRAVTEVWALRGALADAGDPQRPGDTLHFVTIIVSAASAVFTAYATNRSARHLGLWPP